MMKKVDDEEYNNTESVSQASRQADGNVIAQKNMKRKRGKAKQRTAREINEAN